MTIGDKNFEESLDFFQEGNTDSSAQEAEDTEEIGQEEQDPGFEEGQEETSNTDYNEETEEKKKDDKGIEEKDSVPIAALKDERAKRQVLEDQLTKLNERFDRVVETLIARNKPDDDKKEEEPEIPAYETDPLGHFKGTIEKLNKKIEELTTGADKRDKTLEAKNANDQLSTRWLTDVNVASQTTHPDFLKAINYLGSLEAEELKEVGYTEQEIPIIIGNRAKNTIMKAYSNGKSPVDVIYSLAKKRGYKSAEGKEETSRTIRNPKDVRGLNGGSSQSRPGKITAETIAKMSEDDFDKFMKGKTWEDLHGV